MIVDEFVFYGSLWVVFCVLLVAPIVVWFGFCDLVCLIIGCCIAVGISDFTSELV